MFPRYKDRSDLSMEEQKVICVPDLAVHARCAEDELLLLACDGVFDVMTNAEAVSFAQLCIEDDMGPELAAGELVDLAFRLRSFDNISAVLLPLGTDRRKRKIELL